MKLGYWGPQTATIDWCEDNYEVTFYFAEFWNTISNLLMILFPVAFLVVSRKQKVDVESRLCFLSLIVVGVGSWALNMTLLYPMQLLDELPIIWCTRITLYAMFKIEGQLTYWKTVSLVLYSIIFTLTYLWIPTPLMHHSSYAVVVTIAFCKTMISLSGVILKLGTTKMVSEVSEPAVSAVSSAPTKLIDESQISVNSQWSTSSHGDNSASFNKSSSEIYRINDKLLSNQNIVDLTNVVPATAPSHHGEIKSQIDAAAVAAAVPNNSSLIYFNPSNNAAIHQSMYAASAFVHGIHQNPNFPQSSGTLAVGGGGAPPMLAPGHTQKLILNTQSHYSNPPTIFQSNPSILRPVWQSQTIVDVSRQQQQQQSIIVRAFQLW